MDANRGLGNASFHLYSFWMDSFPIERAVCTITRKNKKLQVNTDFPLPLSCLCRYKFTARFSQQCTFSTQMENSPENEMREMSSANGGFQRYVLVSIDFKYLTSAGRLGYYFICIRVV